MEEKREEKLVQVYIRETNESEPIEDASLRNQVSSKPDACISSGINPRGA